MYFVLYLISWSFCNLLKYCLYINQIAKAHSLYLWGYINACWLACFWEVGTLVLVFHPEEFVNYCWIILPVQCLSVTCYNLYYLLWGTCGWRTPLISRKHCYSSESVYRPCCKTWECNRDTSNPATRNIFPELGDMSSSLLQLLCQQPFNTKWKFHIFPCCLTCYT